MRIQKISNSIYMCLRKKRCPNIDENCLDASNMSENNFLNNLVDVDSAFRIFADDRCSPAFWKEKRSELMAMV